jgi:AsmA protein
MSPRTQQILQGLSIDLVRVSDAEVRLVDYETATGKPAESLVRKLNIQLKDVRLEDPIGVKLDAAVFSDAKNFELETAVGPLPADLKLDGMPRLGGLKLRATDVDLSRIAPYLSKTAPKIDSAKLSADLAVGAMDGVKPFDVTGFVGVGGLQFQGGARFDVRVDAKLEVDGGATGAEIEKLDLAVGQVKLAMAGALKDLGGSPKFRDFTLRSTTLDPSALLSYYPAGRAGLPKDLKLKGAATLEVKASGDAQRQTVKAELDLTALDVLYPDALVKPPGTAMALRVDGDFTATDAQLRRLGLQLDELDLNVAGTVKNFKAPSVDLALSAKPFSFDRLVRLLPSANASLAAARAKAEGDGKLTGHVRGSAESLDASLELALTGCKLDVPAARVDGDLRLSVSAKGNPKKDLAATLDFDADKAVLVVPGKVNKSAATPWRMQAALERRGERLEVKKFAVRFAELSLTAAGQVDLGTDATDLKIDMPRLDLEKLAKTITAIPAQKAKAGFVDAKLALKGNPEKLETMQLVLRPFNARLGRSDLSGELVVSNLSRPQVGLSIRSNLLDLDELSPPSHEPKVKVRAKAEPKGPQPPEVDDPSLKDYRMAGAVDLKRVIVRGDELTNFRGRVRLENGVLVLEDCTFQMYDGTISAKGTEAEIWKGRMPFKANLSVKGVDVNKALSAKTRYAGALQGKADFETQLVGEGFETAELEQKLLGNMTVALTQGKLARAGLTEAVLGDFKALEKVPGLDLKAVKSDNTISNLLGHFEVKDGRMTLSRPMSFSLDGNKVVLGGAIGIAGGLFLKGDYFVSQALLEKATGGRCKSSEELRVPVAINGSVQGPQVRPDGKAIALTLAQRCLTGAAGVKLLNTLGLSPGKAGGGAPSQSAPAAAADAAKVDAQALVASEQERLAKERADAQKKAQDELEAQKKKAAEKLKGWFGK